VRIFCSLFFASGAPNGDFPAKIFRRGRKKLEFFMIPEQMYRTDIFRCNSQRSIVQYRRNYSIKRNMRFCRARAVVPVLAGMQRNICEVESMNSQYEQNRALLEAAENCDLAAVEALLQHGADPLGSTDESDPDELVLSELFCEASDDESDLGEKLPQLVELFYAHGMDIGARHFLDDGDNINPLWCLAFFKHENGLKTLKVLLDNGLDFASAESVIGHILVDMEVCNGCEIEDEWWLNSTICGLKMMMLAASYPHIIENSTYIAEWVDLPKNRAENLPRFRVWDDFDYHIDISACTNTENGLQGAIVEIRDGKTKELVWTLGI
jgi:hypothetical protein